MEWHTYKKLKAGDATQMRNIQLGRLNAQNVNAESNATYNDGQSGVAPNPDTSDEKTPLNPDLQSIIEAWPTLQEPLRAAMLAIVRSGG